MANNNKLTKIFLYITVLSCSLWTGAYLMRLFIFYWLFEPEGFVLKSFISEANINGVVYTLLPAVTTTIILYIIFIISFLLFIITTKLKFKENGWLFISTLIIAITFPFEIYLMNIDYKISTSLLSGSFSSENIINLIRERFQVLGNFSLVELFSYFSLFYFILFQPFTKIKNEN